MTMQAIKQTHTNSGRGVAPGIRHHISPKVALSTQEGIWLISWQEILRCAADSNYTRVFLDDGTALLVSKTLARVEAVLPSRHFVRIHQSHLINIGSIRCIAKDNVQLQDGLALPVSRQGKKVLMQTISSISKQI